VSATAQAGKPALIDDNIFHSATPDASKVSRMER